MTLKISISGIRGIANESLTDDVVLNFTKALSIYLGKGPVVVGSDARLSRQHIKDLVISELCSSKIDVIDIGIAPTPTVQIAVRNHSAAGGIVITASHNPPEWNGLKFVREDGIFLNEAQANKLIEIYHGLKKPDISIVDKIPRSDRGRQTFYKKDETALDAHIDIVLKNIDTEAVQKKKFKVALDACNGAGSVITQNLLRRLNCEIISINTDTEKEPPRGAEPIPENLKTLCRITADFNADIGFAQDPDADRLSIVSEEGLAIGEEYCLALSTEFILSQNKNVKNKTVVTNLSTSRMVEDIANKFGARVIRTKVGEVNVSEKMKEVGAIIGGEGNGGIIWPKIGFGRDSISAVGLILNYMASTGKKISALAASIPKYYMIKDKINAADSNEIQKLLKTIEEKYSDEKLDKTDGIKIDYKDAWIHIRGSNTEPIVRIIAEGKDEEKAKGLIEQFKNIGIGQ